MEQKNSSARESSGGLETQNP
jgi:hypothetical protein